MEIKIIDILINAIKQLQIFSSSIEKTEIAFSKFIYQFIDNFCIENKLGLIPQNQYLTKDGIEKNMFYDLSITDKKHNPLALIEFLKLDHFNKSVLESHLERVANSFINEIDFFFIVFYDPNRDYWEKYSNYLHVKEIKEYKKDKNIRIAKHELYKNMYHIFVGIENKQSEIKSKNKIEKIKLYNFKIFEYLEINLTPSVNIFLGKNGFGKTTILQAIALANMPKQTFNIEYRKFIKQKQNSAEIYLKRNDEKELRITIDKEKRVFETEFAQEPIFLAYGPNVFSDETRTDYDNLIESLLNGDSEWCHVNSIFSEYDDKLYNTLTALQKLSDQKSQKATQIKDIIIKKLKDLIPDYKIGTQKNGSDYYFIDNSNNYLDLTQISEGYRTNILLITDIILKIISLRAAFNLHSSLDKVFDKAKGVIAIDEFDRHLHPSWQKKFVSDLQKHFPNIQFILTTHNPVSILNRNENEIQEIIYINDIFQLKKVNEPTSLMDIELILLKYFGLNSVVGDLLQSKIDEYYEKRLKNQDSSNLEKELQNLLVGIPVTDIRYLKFLEMLKQKGYNISNLQQMREIDFSSIAEEQEWKDYLKSLHQ